MRRTSPSILIVRLSAIGDVIMASPLIAALRAKYPQARIAWLVEPPAASLLEAHPGLDRVIVWPRPEWRRLWRDGHWGRLARAARGFLQLLRAERFDLVLDLQGLLKSGVWARASGAPERVGLGSKEGSRVFMTRVVEKPKGDKRMGAEYRHLADTLGLDTRRFVLDVALATEDRAFAGRLLAEHRCESGYAVVCPFTTRPQKHWFEASWLTTMHRLHDELGLAVVMLGGPGDRAAAERLRAPGVRLIDMTGRTSLREAAALIERARLLVGVDTGLTHLGTAFRVPTVVLFGSTCPYLQTESDRTVVLYKALACSPCKRRPTCGGAYTCMQLITPDEVIATARRLLAAP